MRLSRDFSLLPQMESLLAGYSKTDNLYLKLRSYWRVQKQLRFEFVYPYRALSIRSCTQHKRAAAGPLIILTIDASFPPGVGPCRYLVISFRAKYNVY